MLTLFKVTNDTASVDEHKRHLSAFQQCSYCKGSVTEAFLDAVLNLDAVLQDSEFRNVLTKFKVLPFEHVDIYHVSIFLFRNVS